MTAIAVSVLRLASPVTASTGVLSEKRLLASKICCQVIHILARDDIPVTARKRARNGPTPSGGYQVVPAFDDNGMHVFFS